MKTIILALLSSAAFSGVCLADSVPAVNEARKLDFVFSSSKTLYSCDGAQSEMENILKQLHASNIHVTCNGGYPYQESVFVTAHFNSVRPATDGEKSTLTASIATIQVGYSDSCDFHEQLVREVVKEFTVSANRSSGSCWDSQGRYTLDVDVLVAE